ncbi:MAG TPA: hypothetical protein VG758_32985 [Hyphomicrobiaceae bacterium]|nr:hypothetical protein [Hyphomicrobiaceae bacterium]
MLNAVWLVPIALWLAHGHDDAEASPLAVFYFGVAALFWLGHRFASAWLAYFTEAYRPLVRNQPVRFVVLPLLVTAACFAVFLPADHVYPWTRQERVVAMAILDYAFVTYHFAAQHFGALSLYRARAERAGCPRARRFDRLFALGVGGALVLVAEILAGSAAFQEVWVHRSPVAGCLLSNQEGISEAALIALVAATALILVAEARATRPSPPRVLYILGVAAMVAIALQTRSLFVFIVLWTSQHWILATGLASITPGQEPAPAGGVIRQFLHALNTRPWAILLVLAVLSVLLLPFLEVEVNQGGGTYYGEQIFGSFATALRTSSWVPALVAAGFATGFMHYLLDRGVYRMSDPQVRSAARGLLVK